MQPRPRGSSRIQAELTAPPRRIQNPLAGIPKEQLLRDVDRFANEVGMAEHIPLLQRGALVAQDPAGFEQVSELEGSERDALRNEVLHKWRQPLALYVTVILCSVGAAVQGWDQTGSNGANLSWPVAFGVPDTGDDATDWNVWIGTSPYPARQSSQAR